MLYFDNSATTRIAEEVIEAMMPFIKEEYGNPDGKYYDLALSSKNAINSSREVVSAFVGCKVDELIFTSGASESNNTVIKGLLNYPEITNQHFVTTRIEHSSIIEPLDFICSLGAKVSYVDVDSSGMIVLESLDKVLSNGANLLAISLVNSEIGTVQLIKEINEICKLYNVPILLDITQALSKIRIDLSEFSMVHYASFSSHKIYGPKGVGAMVIKKDNDGVRRSISPLIHGGHQEYKYRAGTSPVHLIVGFGKAVEIMLRDFHEISFELKEMDELFISLANSVDVIEINNNHSNRVNGIISCRFRGFNNQLLLKKASKHFAASTGSACSNTKPSYVLREIGLSEKEISESIRFSLGRYNNAEDIKKLFEILK